MMSQIHHSRDLDITVASDVRLRVYLHTACASGAVSISGARDALLAAVNATKQAVRETPGELAQIVAARVKGDAFHKIQDAMLKALPPEFDREVSYVDIQVTDEYGLDMAMSLWIDPSLDKTPDTLELARGLRGRAAEVLRGYEERREENET